MRARVVEPARGMRWIFEGCRLFLSAPVGWFAITFSYLMITLLLSVVPLIGAPLGLILYPAFTVGFLAASRARALRQPLELPVLFAGFRERVPQQLALGAVYIGGIVLAILGSSLVDDGALLRIFSRPADAGEPIVMTAETRSGALMALLLYLPTFMTTFFAPVLVAWHAVRPAKALFYSFFACLLNWRAFLIYMTAGILLMVVATNVIFALAIAIAGAEVRANPAMLFSILVPVALFTIVPVMMTSAYVSYRDVFGAPEDA
ncbi:MAG: BPSS1780 family membrane protein [Burkholderiales bacterium]